MFHVEQFDLPIQLFYLLKNVPRGTSCLFSGGLFSEMFHVEHSVPHHPIVSSLKMFHVEHLFGVRMMLIVNTLFGLNVDKINKGLK